MKPFVAEKTPRRSRGWGTSQTKQGVGFYFYLTWICIRSAQPTSTKLLIWRHKILISWLAVKAGSALTGKCLPAVWFVSFPAVAANSIHEQPQACDISHMCPLTVCLLLAFPFCRDPAKTSIQSSRKRKHDPQDRREVRSCGFCCLTIISRSRELDISNNVPPGSTRACLPNGGPV